MAVANEKAEETKQRKTKRKLIYDGIIKYFMVELLKKPIC